MLGHFLEAVVRRCSIKNVFVEISQNSQENTCARLSFLIKKNRLWHRCFPVNFAKFLRTPLMAASDFSKMRKINPNL